MFWGAKSSTIQRVFTRYDKSLTISSFFFFLSFFNIAFVFLYFPFLFLKNFVLLLNSLS